MRRFLIVLTLTCLVAVAAACGSGSSDSTSVAKDDVAVVGDTTITVDQLNRQIELAKKTAQVNGQKVPRGRHQGLPRHAGRRRSSTGWC